MSGCGTEFDGVLIWCGYVLITAVIVTETKKSSSFQVNVFTLWFVIVLIQICKLDTENDWIQKWCITACYTHLGGLTVVCQTKGFFSALTNSIVYQSFWWSHKNMQIQVPLWDYSGGQIELHYGIKLLFTSTPPAKTVFDLTNQLIATIYLLQSLLIHLLKHFLYFSMSKWTKGFSSVPFQFSLD